MGCDLCGKTGALWVCAVEGTEMQLCEKCKSYGAVKRAVASTQAPPPKKKEGVAVSSYPSQRAMPERVEKTEQVVANFAARIKQARERLGLKQDEFAKKLNIRESMLHKYETGNLTPDLETAAALARALKIKLVEEVEEKTSVSGVRRNAGPLTIGDIFRKC